MASRPDASTAPAEAMEQIAARMTRCAAHLRYAPSVEEALLDLERIINEYCGGECSSSAAWVGEKEITLRS